MADASPVSPRVGVSVALVKKQKELKVLFVRRAQPPLAGTWSLPGGRAHWGETMWQTAHRELHEEAGLVARPLQILTATDSIFSSGADTQDHWQIITVVMAWQTGEPRAASDAQETAWMTPDQGLAKITWMPLRGVLLTLKDASLTF
ncbi:MAG: NUDIX domain-containing protein [Pseudomonadota bacterium]